MRRILFPTIQLVLLLAAAPATAHYNMLLPARASVQKGETVVLVYQWGHPFEHQLFDAPAPQRLSVVAPDDSVTDLTKNLEKIAVPAGDKKATAYQLRYAPQQRGDHVFVLQTPPIWMEEEHEFYQDTVKVVLHVQTQKGWDRTTGQPLELTPLTRPYGLLPGTVFQARLTTPEQGLDSAPPKPLRSLLVEVERYNATAPKELPADEFITRTVKTDPTGVATCTLPEAGWWCLTAARSAGQKEREGKQYPWRQRTTFWVFVDEKARVDSER